MSRPSPSHQNSVWTAAGMPALLLITAAGFAGYSALLSVAPLWAVHGGSGSAGSGFVNGVLLLATIITQPFVPALLGRLGTGRVLAAGLALLGGPALLLLLSDHLVWILALSVLRGLGFGILTVTGSAVVADLVPPERHGAAIGAYGAAIAIPQVLLLPAGPWIADTVGFWAVFILATLPVLGIGVAPRLARVMREQDAERRRVQPGGDDPQSPHIDEGGPVRWRVLSRLIRPMFLLLGVTLAGGALITFAPQMSADSAATTGGLALLTGIAALSRWRIGAIADKHGIRPFLWPMVLLTVAGLALAAFAVQEIDNTRIVELLIAMTLVGIAYGGLQNVTLLLSFASVRRENYGTASAVWNVGFDAGTGIGSVLVGTLAAGLSFSTALLVAACISLATLPLALLRTRDINAT